MAQLVIQCASDAYLQTPQQDTNFGGDSLVLIGPAYFGAAKQFADRPIANFDVSALAGATIVAAKLVRNIFSIDGGGFAAHVYRCTRPSAWTENGVTWKKYDGVNEWTAHGGDWDASTPAPLAYNEATSFGTNEIAGLAPFVTDALELRGGIVSIIMKADDELPGGTHTVAWNARHNSPGWQLVVDYEPPNRGRRGGAGAGRERAPRREVRPPAGRRSRAPRGGRSS
jgi:hypothetical protein